MMKANNYKHQTNNETYAGEEKGLESRVKELVPSNIHLEYLHL